MPTNSYTASLNYYDSSYGWANEGTCSQGNCTPWGGGSARTGVMYFSGLSSLKGKALHLPLRTVNPATAMMPIKQPNFTVLPDRAVSALL